MESPAARPVMIHHPVDWGSTRILPSYHVLELGYLTIHKPAIQK